MAYRNKKRDTIKAFFKNDSMAKIIQDALVSPIGSTPRKRAQKLVSIMKKMNRYDGAGGPGSLGMRATQPRPIQSPIARRKVRKNTRVFHPAPKMSPIGKQQAMDGAGGLGVVGPGWSSTSTAPMLNAQSTSSNINSNPYQKNDYGLLGNAPYYANAAGNALISGAGATSGLSKSPTVGNLASIGQFALQNTAQAATQFNPYSMLSEVLIGKSPQGPGYVSWGNTQGQQLNRANQSAPGSTVQSNNTRNPGALTGPRTISGIINSQNAMGGLTAPTPGTLPGSGQSGGSSLTGETSEQSGQDVFDSLLSNSNQSDPYSYIDGYNSASAFAMAMMNDKEALRKIPGLEKVPDEMLPVGASLAGHMNRVWQLSRLESGVDESMRTLEESVGDYNSFLDGGVGLQTRLTDYVRRRDEFLNETTDMMDDFKRKVYSGQVDTYNPATAKMAQSYMGYLGTLQGRQNKRYVEWVNGSIDAYKTAVDAAAQKAQNNMSIYDRKMADFENRYQTQGTIALTEYNQVRDMLIETYNHAAEAPKRAQEAEMWEIEKMTKLADAVKSLAGTGFEIEGMGTADTDGWAWLNKNSNAFDKDGNLTDNGRNIGSIWGNAQGNASLDSVLKFYDSNIYKDFGDNVPVEKLFSNAAVHLSSIAQFKEAIESFEDVPQDKKDMYLNRLEGAANQVKNYISSKTKANILANDEQKNGMRDAVKYLIDKSNNTFFKPSKADFVKANSDSGLPQDLLEDLFTITQEYLSEEGANINDMFIPDNYDEGTALKKVSDSDLVNHIIGLLYDPMSNY